VEISSTGRVLMHSAGISFFKTPHVLDITARFLLSHSFASVPFSGFLPSYINRRMKNGQCNGEEEST